MRGVCQDRSSTTPTIPRATTFTTGSHGSPRASAPASTSSLLIAGNTSQSLSRNSVSYWISESLPAKDRLSVGADRPRFAVTSVSLTREKRPDVNVGEITNGLIAENVGSLRRGLLSTYRVDHCGSHHETLLNGVAHDRNEHTQRSTSVLVSATFRIGGHHCVVANTGTRFIEE